MIRLGRLLAAFLLAVVALPAAAQAPQIRGTLRLGDTDIPLTHVSARQARSSRGDGHTIILMADRDPPPEVIASRRAYIAAAREGRIRGLLLVLEPAPRLILFTPAGYDETEIPDTFQRLTLDLPTNDETVAGRLHTTAAREVIPGATEGGDPVPYTLDVSFEAFVVAAPSWTSASTGPAARNSLPALAAHRALQAIFTGSAADVRALLAPDHPAMAAPDDEAFAEMIALARANLPQPDAFLQSVENVTGYDDLAIVTGRDAGGEVTVALRRIGDEWRLTTAPIDND